LLTIVRVHKLYFLTYLTTILAVLLILQVDHEGAQKHTRTKFDEFTELQDIFVELVVVDDREDGLVQPLQLFHIVNRHITQLYYATATSNHSNSCS